MDAQGRDRGLAIAGLVLSVLAIGMHLLLPLLDLASMPWMLRFHRWNHF